MLYVALCQRSLHKGSLTQGHLMRHLYAFAFIASMSFVTSRPVLSAEDQIAAFYLGKTITLTVAAGAGGSYDVYARALADHYGRHIPGQPSVVVKLTSGVGGGIATAIQLENTAAKDGTIIGMTQQTNLVSQLTETAAMGKYDVGKWQWLGLMAPVRNMLAVWYTAPAQTLEQAKQKEVVIGATGRASPTFSVPQALNQLIGTKFKMVLGYQGVNDLNLAMERGEIQGRGASWSSVMLQAPNYIIEKKLKPLVVDGLTREPSLPDVPLLVDLATTDQQRQAVRLMSSAAEFGRAIFAPPGVPAERVEALRRSFDATMRDPQFLAEAEKLQLPIEPARGEELQRITKDVLATTPEAIAYARDLMGSQ
jgi:tripartite-type tricarboxylate transporter receptor subunit TctC